MPENPTRSRPQTLTYLAGFILVVAAMYWARALADQTKDEALRRKFAPVADALEKNEAKILAELTAVQGKPVAIGGYYHPDPKLCAAAMRPSATLNSIIDRLG